MRVLWGLLLAALAIVPNLLFGQVNPGVEPPKLSLIERREEIIKISEKRIQEEILDRVLGPGKASVFVSVDLDVKASRKENLRAGAGSAEKNKVKLGQSEALKTDFVLPGVPKPKNITAKEQPRLPEAAQAQTAQQTRIEQEEVFSQQVVFKRFQVVVLHDAQILDKKLSEIRSLIVHALDAYKVRPDDIVFRKANYHVSPRDSFLGQLMDPKVYIPLLYALLLFLLLSFLFGPFAKFLRRYTEALMAKPAAEVNVESNIEPPDDGEDSEGEDEVKSYIDLMVGRKSPEPPPPLPPPPPIIDAIPLEDSGLEDEMEKLEVFTYINEENLNRLANLFQLRSEEPWLIAVVLSYLKQDFAREVLSSLPAELQAKVAMEALKVRQVTKEQILAIDEDVRQNIDYVVGGVERLIQMLEEADPTARQNILESLQNEKPNVYEHVRQSILLFDDIASFDDRDMQVIVRELKTETMSKALHGCSPEVVNKFFSNMSAGAASLLKESMEYQQNVSQNMVDEARAEIMEQIKRFNKEGKVNLQQGGAAGGFHQIIASESVRGKRLSQLSAADAAAPGAAPGQAASAPAADPEKAKKAFDAGTQAQQSGNVDEAIVQFRQALEHDPELWDAYQYLGQSLYQVGRQSESVIYYEKYLQHNPDPQLRAWVDSFKTQMGAS
jgi:tetratricopeptide (TPR) repeat protein